jgi:hypothetical protein
MVNFLFAKESLDFSEKIKGFHACFSAEMHIFSGFIGFIP